ncbi:MAG: DinB family protein [Bacillota bacterium]
MQQAFADVDQLVESFLLETTDRHDAPRTIEVSWQPEPLRLTARWLMTHMTTHEFHHKGQVASIGRILGYPPPETDLALPR